MSCRGPRRETLFSYLIDEEAIYERINRAYKQIKGDKTKMLAAVPYLKMLEKLEEVKRKGGKLSGLMPLYMIRVTVELERIARGNLRSDELVAGGGVLAFYAAKNLFTGILESMKSRINAKNNRRAKGAK